MSSVTTKVWDWYWKSRQWNPLFRVVAFFIKLLLVPVLLFILFPVVSGEQELAISKAFQMITVNTCRRCGEKNYYKCEAYFRRHLLDSGVSEKTLTCVCCGGSLFWEDARSIEE